MKLLYSPTSPFARKVLVLAYELGVQAALDLETIDPWTDETLRKANPFCQVPTLVLKDGTGVYDSAVICDYLDTLGRRRAVPAAGPARLRALTLQALGDGICNAAVRRVREEKRPEPDRHMDLLRRQRQAMTAALDVLEGNLDGLSESFTVGQIAVACTLGYLDLRFATDHWRQGRPHLAGWFDAVAQRPSMVATAPPG